MMPYEDPNTFEALAQETASYNEQTKAVKEEIASLEPQVRARMLSEFDEAMEQVTIASDDYRRQELRFVRAFAQMREILSNHLQSLHNECVSFKGDKR